MDAVHKQSDGDGGGGGGEEGGGSSSSLPRIEDITDTMIFSPTDLVTMTCRDVDLSFAVRGKFSDREADVCVKLNRCFSLTASSRVSLTCH